MMYALLSLILTFVVISVIVVNAVDRSKFRTCSDTGFCKRYRDITTGPTYNSNYLLDASTIKIDDTSGLLTGSIITPATTTTTSSQLQLQVSVLEHGLIRCKIKEIDHDRWQPNDLLQANSIKPTKLYSILSSRDIDLVPLALHSKKGEIGVSMTVISFNNNDSVLVIYTSPFKIELYNKNVLQIVVNDRMLMHYEMRQKNHLHHSNSHSHSHSSSDGDTDRHKGKEVADYGEDGLAIYADGTKEEKKAANDEITDNTTVATAVATESFGGHTDSMPHGPMSVGIDFSFPYAQHVYGIPEHASPLSLPTTVASSAGMKVHYQQPYRLYNLDVFEYQLDESMALYGNIPLLLAHGLVNGKGLTSGMFWFNPSETFVDISDGNTITPSQQQQQQQVYKESNWISETGEIDFFLLSGPTPRSIFSQFTSLVGRQQLPPMFSLGYHQCRWNYRDEKDVAAVEGMFEKLDYPMDVLWLDIEHTNGKRYFTWDSLVFPNPIEMQQNLTKHGRKMVTIVDPHIKRDESYHIHKEATAKGLYVKNKDGNDYDGWCWPGSSSYLDFTSAKVREWWGQQFALDKYIGSTLDLFTWNDMNEPSVFNGPEVSMNKDAMNLDGIEHRDWHNLYGIYMQQATANGLSARSLVSTTTSMTSDTKQYPQRPFVLTRSFWAGSQRFGAMWTGDNTAEWGHLKVASPMLLSINLAGLSFAGADVGGFFGEPSAELFTRWYQAGSFTPFFRGHAHHDTKRREPWVYGDVYTPILRKAAMIRYSLLPYWYTVFYDAYSKGYPVMRTMFAEYPDDEATYAMDDQWLIGDSLLVKPVTDVGITSIDIYLPRDNVWYDLLTLHVQPISTSSVLTTVPAALDKIPVYIRGGSIIPRKMRLRRSSKLMFFDPYTLVICPDAGNTAVGYVYVDDETSLAHEVDHMFAHRMFSYKDNTITSVNAATASGTASGTDGNRHGHYDAVNVVERIEIANQASSPRDVVLVRGAAVAVTVSGTDDDVVRLTYYYDSNARVLTIKKPDVKIGDDWVITMLY